MKLVRRLYDETLNLDDFEPKHLGYLLERVTRRMRADLGRIDLDQELRARHQPLTPAYFRVLAMIPVNGARITDVAAPAAMTKQALGQFVDVLVEHGYLTVHRDAADGRARIVRRTDKGDEVVRETEQMYDELHARWSALIGPERWALLQETLVELATGWEDTPE